MLLSVCRTTDEDFETTFAALARRRSGGQGLDETGPDSPAARVAAIMAAVRERGDEAVAEFTERFDGCALTPEQFRVSEAEIDAAVAATSPEVMAALELAAGRIRRFQESIRLEAPAPLDEGGRMVGVRYAPVDAAGLCVPGASASLASSVLMNAVPAAAAGVGRIVMITPPAPDGAVSADRLAAARVAGVTEVYRVFGAQGVAAIAYGTDSIPPVDFIAGPGNVYVQLAKKAAFGQVGIDMIAGPSEVVVLADATAPPAWVAAELLSQAEHHDGGAVLVTDSAALVSAVEEALEAQLARHAHAAGVRAHLAEFGGVIVTREVAEGVEVCDRMAAEHLVVMTADADAVAARVRHAGAIFIGHQTPVAVGDYVAGPSHCLPTGTTARFSGGLTVNSFRKSTSLIRYTAAALRADREALSVIGGAEGLEAHVRSVDVRLRS